MQFSVRTHAGIWLAVLVAAVLLVVGGQAMAGTAPVRQDAQGYAGEKTCLTCHEAQTKGYHGTPHGQSFNEKSPIAGLGCESCHGPGKAHADAGGDKSKIASYKSMKADEASATCTGCHSRASHALWDGSAHDQRGVGCITCHSVHAPKMEKAQLKAKSETELCASCHRNQVNKQNRFNHMPVREGKMECGSCHNVHGSANVKLLKKGVTLNESCVSCHSEKRGPMLWEHPPVAETCTTCHDAHGTNNDRMLSAKQPFLCQRCHVTSRHPPTVYEGYLLRTSQNANKIYGRSCLACHQMVHGSNAPTGKAFLR